MLTMAALSGNKANQPQADLRPLLLRRPHQGAEPELQLRHRPQADGGQDDGRPTSRRKPPVAARWWSAVVQGMQAAQASFGPPPRGRDASGKAGASSAEEIAPAPSAGPEPTSDFDVRIALRPRTARALGSRGTSCHR